MTDKITIFMTGVTGYIGGSIFSLINLSKYHVVALVRTETQANICKKYNIESVIGDIDSLEILEKQAYRADVVMHLANCSNSYPIC
jgi:nucleoside-diphosphate-sugar epimerase